MKDSLTYLDHINGKKHQRNLGMSMRIERSSLDQVSRKLIFLTQNMSLNLISWSFNQSCGSGMTYSGSTTQVLTLKISG